MIIVKFIHALKQTKNKREEHMKTIKTTAKNLTLRLPVPVPVSVSVSVPVPVLVLVLILIPLPVLILSTTSCSDKRTIDNAQDASIDATHEDRSESDDDGQTIDVFCDNNPDFPPGTRRDCQSECDYGSQVCLANGEWSDCTAVTDCDCTNPGETRIIDCGNCGQASQECGLDLKWSFPEQCFGEGECTPGVIDTEPCEYGGNRTRLCNNECEWGEWDTTTCGICPPGTTTATNEGCNELWEIQKLECNSDGLWEVTIPCTADCHFPARESAEGEFKEDICIPGGPFIMGNNPGVGQPNETPKHTVILTPYFIDKYEVSVSRYKECIDDGVCTRPSQWDLYPPEDDLPFPAHNTDTETAYEMAETFCQWDGGRVLPTEAQWEKAARGPAPREVLYPWGDDEPTCDLVCSMSCPSHQPLMPVNFRMDSASYYGVIHMGTNFWELCSDFYDPDYYSVSPLVDPTGPETGVFRSGRGLGCVHSLDEYLNWNPVTRRGEASGDMQGFRCSRRGY